MVLLLLVAAGGKQQGCVIASLVCPINYFLAEESPPLVSSPSCEFGIPAMVNIVLRIHLRRNHPLEFQVRSERTTLAPNHGQELETERVIDHHV